MGISFFRAIHCRWPGLCALAVLVLTLEPAHPTPLDGHGGIRNIAGIPEVGATAQHKGTTDTTPPEITVLGGELVRFECSFPYADPGVTASDDTDGDLSASVTVGGNAVDPQTLGTYLVTYAVQDQAGNTASASRTVIIQDTIPPEIRLIGAPSLVVDCGAIFDEPGAIARDACEGIVMVSSVNEVNTGAPGEYVVRYQAVDASGNRAESARVVTVRDVAPDITILGEIEVVLECGSPFDDPGVLAIDPCEGQVSYRTFSDVDTEHVGVYTVRYVATDRTGRTATATRLVSVRNETAPTITLKGPDVYTLDCGTVYRDPGVTATDSCGHALLVSSNAASVLDTDTAGEYTILYRATDPSGNQASTTRTVRVQGNGCSGQRPTCPVEAIDIVDPPGDIVIPAGQASLDLVLHAVPRYGIAQGPDGCVKGTVDVYYSLDGVMAHSADEPGRFPASYTLAPGDYLAIAAAEEATTMATLQDTLAFQIRTAPDEDRDGVVDTIFASLTAEGDTWHSEIDNVGETGAVRMVTWFGDCGGPANGNIRLSVANPNNPEQTLTVTASRDLLACGEQGMLMVKMADDIGTLLGANATGNVPAPPRDKLAASPYFAVAVVVSPNGGQTYGPISPEVLAGRPLSVSLDSLSNLDGTSTFKAHPARIVASAGGGLSMTTPESVWTTGDVAGVLATGGTLQAAANAAAVYCAVQTVEQPEGVACAPGRHTSTGGAATDLALLVALILTLAAASRRVNAPESRIN